MARWRWNWIKLAEGGWLLFWLIASSIWCVSASWRLSATFDEPTYISLGLESWRTGSYKRLIDLGTMPLPPLVQTLPLHLWELWREQPWDLVQDLDVLLPVARYGTLPFWGLLMVYGWRSGRQIAGVWGGRLTVLLLACEPNLLAHASLATTDIAVTACLLALFYHFRRDRNCTWPKRVLLPAVWFALAVLAKASGLVFGVIGLSVLAAGTQFSEAADTDSRVGRFRSAAASIFRKPVRRDLFQIYGLGLLAVFLFCGSEGLASPSFVEWARGLPGGSGQQIMVWVAEHLRIFSNAGVALVRQFRHNIQGHGVFLLEQVERRAIWYYFPLALSIKMPVPLLLVLPLLALVCRRALRNWACLIALALLLFSLVCRVQTGIRLVLPLVSLAVIGLAAGFVVACQQSAPGSRRRMLTAIGVSASGWLIWSSLSVWPHGLCYTNELWGGTVNGYHCLSDSNYDWGQGLKELAQWQQEHQIQDLDVLYYGTDTRLRRLPMRPLVVGALNLDRDDLPTQIQGRLFAVSTSIVHGSVSEIFMDLKALAHALRRMEPVDRTTTFLIYRRPSAKEMASANDTRTDDSKTEP